MKIKIYLNQLLEVINGCSVEHVFETKGYVVSQSISSIINTSGTARRRRGWKSFVFLHFCICEFLYMFVYILALKKPPSFKLLKNVKTSKEHSINQFDYHYIRYSRRRIEGVKIICIFTFLFL